MSDVGGMKEAGMGMASGAGGGPGGTGTTQEEVGRRVGVKLAAETQDYQKQMGLAAQATHDLLSVLVALEKTIAKTLKTAGAVTAATGGAMAASLGMATNAAMKFEDSFARAEKTLSGTKTEITSVSHEIRALSTQIPVAAEELSRLADIAGQKGISTENISEVVQTAAELGVATSMSAEQALSSMAQVINVTGEAEENIRNLASALARLDVGTNASAGQMMHFASQVSGAASTVGMASEEIVAIGAAVTSMGVNVQAGATAVQRELLNMNSAVQRGGEELDKFASAMDMTSDQFKRLFQSDPAETFTRFVESLADAGNEADQVLQQLNITNERSRRTFLALAEAGDKTRHAMMQAREAFEDGGDIAELAAIRFGTLRQQMSRLRNSISEAWRSIASMFLPVLTKLVEMMTAVVNAFNKLPAPVRAAIGIFAALASPILIAGGALVFLIGKLLPLIHTVGLLSVAVASLHGRFPRLDRAVYRASAAIGVLLGRVSALTGALAGKGLMMLLGELVHSLRATGRAATGAAAALMRKLIPSMAAVRAAAAAMLLPFLKWAAIITAVIVVGSKLKGVFDGWRESSRSAADETQKLADQLGTVHEKAKPIPAVFSDATDEGRRFARQNEEVITSLEGMDQAHAKAEARMRGRRLIQSGASIEEAEDLMNRLLEQAGKDYTISFDDSRVEQYKDSLQDLNDRMSTLNRLARETRGQDGPLGNLENFLLGRPSAEFERKLETEIEDVAKRLEKGDFGTAFADAFRIEEQIEKTLTGAEKRRAEHRLHERIRDIIPGDIDFGPVGLRDQLLPQRDRDLMQPFQDLLENPRMAGSEYEERVVELRRKLRLAGIAAEDLNQVNMDNFIDTLSEVGVKAMENREAVADLEEDATRLERVLAGGPEDTDSKEARRFREQRLEQMETRLGVEASINVYEEFIEKQQQSSDEAQRFGDTMNDVRKQVKDLREEMAKIEVADLEEEMNGKEAAAQIKLINDRLRELDMSDATDVRIFEEVAGLRQKVISGLERDLRQLFDQRDRMNERIVGLEERRTERIEDLRERHADRLEKLEERRTERIADLHENHHERLVEMEERRNERIAELKEQHAEGLEDLEERRQDSIETAEERYQDALEDIEEREEESLENRKDRLAKFVSAQDKLFTQHAQSAEGLAENLAMQTKRMEESLAGLQKLREMGLSQGAIDLLELDNPRNFAQVGRLLENAMADPAMIERINQEWEDRSNVAEAYAEATNTGKNSISEKIEEMRADAKESFNEALADINEDHKEAIKDQGERLAEAIEEVNAKHQEGIKDQAEALQKAIRETNENHKEAVENQKENLAESIANVKESVAESIADVRSDISELGSDALKTIDELVKEGINSDIAGIKDRAEVLKRELNRAAGEIVEAAEEGVERASKALSPETRALLTGSEYAPTNVGIGNFDGMIGLMLEVGKEVARGFEEGYVKKNDKSWQRIKKDSEGAANATAEGSAESIQVGLEEFMPPALETLRSETDIAWENAKDASVTGANNTVDRTVDALEKGTGRIGRTIGKWATKISDELNPILESIGADTIEVKSSSKPGRTGTGTAAQRHTGGLVDDSPPYADPNDLTKDERLVVAQKGEEVLTRPESKQYHQLKRLLGIQDEGEAPPRVPGIGKLPANDLGYTAGEAAGYTSAELNSWLAKQEAKRRKDDDIRPGGGIGGGIGVAAMMAKLRDEFEGLPLISGYRPGSITATGKASWHGKNRAVDVPPRMDVFNWLRSNYGSKSLELIYSPANNRQIYKGREHMYTGQTRKDHWDHIHWAMANGGIINEPVMGVGQRTGQTYSFGESGPEAVTPVQERGREPVMASSGRDRQELANAIKMAMPEQGAQYGPITVEAQDPNEMERKLEAKKRLRKLTR